MRTNKRKITKRRIKRRHTRKHTRRHTRKHTRRHTRKQIRKQSKKRQYRYRGGRFNETQEQILKNKIREIGFTDEEEINNIVVNILGRTAQLFADENGFEQTIYQIEGFTDPEQFRQWVNSWDDSDEDLVQTDPENTPTD
jgi:hypothetical protein